MRYRLIDTPTGPFAILEDASGVRTTWVDGPTDDALGGAIRDQTLRPALAASLAQYFAGDPVDFSGVPTPTGPPFMQRCWSACRRIPLGSTISYGELATMAGSGPGAARAAGQSMRHNPLPIVVPCHRVLAAHGRLGGFAGDDTPGSRSLAIKSWLLEHEARLVERRQPMCAAL